MTGVQGERVRRRRRRRMGQPRGEEKRRDSIFGAQILLAHFFSFDCSVHCEHHDCTALLWLSFGSFCCCCRRDLPFRLWWRAAALEQQAATVAAAFFAILWFWRFWFRRRRLKWKQIEGLRLPDGELILTETVTAAYDFAFFLLSLSRFALIWNRLSFSLSASVPVSAHFPPDQNILTYSVVLYLSDSDSLFVCVCVCVYVACRFPFLFPFPFVALVCLAAVFFLCTVCGGTVVYSPSSSSSSFSETFLPFRCLSCLPCLAHFSVMMMMIVFSIFRAACN